MVELKMSFQKRRGNYGTRRLKRRLASLGYPVSRRRIGHLLKRAGLICKAKRKFRVTTDSKHQQPISKTVSCWEAWSILCRRHHLYWDSGRLVVFGRGDWVVFQAGCCLSMDKQMQAKLVNNAILMAIWKRKPGKGLIWHTDWGRQYASDSHWKILTQHGIIQSMSRKANCWASRSIWEFFPYFENWTGAPVQL